MLHHCLWAVLFKGSASISQAGGASDSWSMRSDAFKSLWNLFMQLLYLYAYGCCVCRRLLHYTRNQRLQTYIFYLFGLWLHQRTWTSVHCNISSAYTQHMILHTYSHSPETLFVSVACFESNCVAMPTLPLSGSVSDTHSFPLPAILFKRIPMQSLVHQSE